MLRLGYVLTVFFATAPLYIAALREPAQQPQAKAA